VFICDDPFEAIGVWGWILATQYNYTLYDFNLYEVIRMFVPPNFIAQQQQHQQQQQMDINDFEL